MLLGLLSDGAGTAAAALLDSVGLPMDSLQEPVRKLIPSQDPFSTAIEIPFSSEMRQLLHHAADEARDLEHEHVGTEHLLLGLLHIDSPATALLESRGVSAETIREATRTLSAPLQDRESDIA